MADMCFRRLAFVLTTLSLACSSDDLSESRSERHSDSAAGVVIDSIFPLEEALRRFRTGIPRTTELQGGALSRDALVERFALAVRERDSVALREMVLSRAEFAWLYYPTSVFSREPYYQMPQLTWFLNTEDSRKGITRVLERFGGADPGIAGYACRIGPRSDGGLTFWDACLVELELEGERRRLRLFGSIVELGGRYKFYSYANDL
jgi:hypothetical protein